MKQTVIITIVFLAFAAGTNALLEFVLDFSLFEAFETGLKEPGLAAAGVLALLLIVDVFLPIPSSVVMVLSGTLFGTVAGGLLSLTASLIGNVAGFELMTRFGAGLFRRFVNEDHIRRIQPVVEEFGSVSIAASRALPIVCETASLVAGIVRMKRSNFVTAAALGTVPVTFIYSYAGSSSIAAGSVAPAAFVMVGIPAVGWLLAHRWMSKAKRSAAVKTSMTVLAVLAMTSSVWAQSADIVVSRLASSMAVKAAHKFTESDQNRILDETAALETSGDSGKFADLLKAQGWDVQTDASGNVLGSSVAASGRPLVAIAAHLDDARALSSLLGAMRAMNSERLNPGNRVLLVGLADRHAAPKTPAIDYLLREGAFKDRIRNFVIVETRQAGHISIAPKTIGSALVQSALESMISLGLKPQHEEGLSDRETVADLKIPSVAIGCGYSSPIGVQALMTTILAVGGIR